jgi:ribose 5-phosphate isomerase B
MMRIGSAADHGGFSLKGELAESLRRAGYDVGDFGADQLDPANGYPDFVVPFARAVAAGEVERGVSLCGSGVGASIAASKVPGVRAGQLVQQHGPHRGRGGLGSRPQFCFLHRTADRANRLLLTR